MTDRRHQPLDWPALLLAAVVWALVLITFVYPVPGWLFWPVFGLSIARLLWLYRPHSARWRVTDDRRPDWARKDDDG